MVYPSSFRPDFLCSRGLTSTECPSCHTREARRVADGPIGQCEMVPCATIRSQRAKLSATSLGVSRRASSTASLAKASSSLLNPHSSACSTKRSMRKTGSHLACMPFYGVTRLSSLPAGLDLRFCPPPVPCTLPPHARAGRCCFMSEPFDPSSVEAEPTGAPAPDCFNCTPACTCTSPCSCPSSCGCWCR